MSRRTLIFVLFSLGIVGGLSFFAADLWIAPGHATPGHRAVADDCFACHRPFFGTPAERCARCHRFDSSAPVPANGKIRPDSPLFALHRDATLRVCTNCHTLHLTPGAKITTFDHRSLFPLDPPHDASCSTCHTTRDFRRYTCTGCHEHSPARLAHEHAEEGITRLDDCVRCHRSGREHGGGNEDD